MSAPLTLESLAEMFPAYSINVIRDVAEQCGNNHELVLEKLLELQSDEPRCEPLPAPPAALQTQQAMHSVLFPREKGPGPPKVAHSHPNGHTGDHLAGPSAPPLHPADVSLDACSFPATNNQAQDVSCQDIIPGLVSLDTGQRRPGVRKTGTAQAIQPSGPSRRPAVATSRGWWPSWPLTPTRGGGQLPVSRAGISLGVCAHSAATSSTPNGAPAGRTRPATPPRAVVPTPGCEHRTPSRTVPGSAHNGTPTTPLLFVDDPLNPGTFPGPERALRSGPSSPCSDDEMLAALMPHLAHCLTSPSLSGTSSPMLRELTAGGAGAAEVRMLPQRSRSQQQEGYGATELVAAVQFYLQMFPNLKREVVGDVLQRYSDTPQAGLDQLIMLSSCVDDAAAEGERSDRGSGGGSYGVPDPAGWESPGSGSDEEEANGHHKSAGSSWEAGLTPDELAGMAVGIFPHATPSAPRAQHPAPALSGVPERAAFPLGGEDDLLPAEEKEELLRAEFKSVAAEEVAAALAACDGSLFAAAELLRSFAAEDAQAGGLNGDAQHIAAAAAASVPAAAAHAPPEPTAGGTFLPQHVRPKVQHLARRFPEVPNEALEVALASCNYDLPTARRTLHEAGYTEAAAAPSPAHILPLPSSLPAALSVAPMALPHPVPLPPRAVAGSPPLGAPPGLSLSHNATPQQQGLSLSEATYQRNQAIWEQERAKAQRLEQAYRRCFELAAEAHSRGDHTAAAELSMRGREYRQQFHDEQSKASRRISKRVNAANGLPRIRVDLHGQTVGDALATVENGIRNLPESIPGGVVVRYVTGKGLHSLGGAARIKPEVIRLLSERGIPFVEAPNGGGWVEATLVPVN